MPNLSSVITQTLGGSPIGVNLVSSPSSTASGWSATAPATVTTTSLASELPLGSSSTTAVKLNIGNSIGAVALNFEVPVSMRQSVVGINWWQLVSSSPAFTSSSVTIALTSYTDQARTLGSRTYTLPVSSLSTANNFFGTQFTADDRQYYTLAFGMVSPNTAWISLAQVFIGQVANNQSAAMGLYSSYTPAANVDITTTSGSLAFGTIVANKATIWRSGSNAIIRWDYSHSTAGSAGAGRYQFTMPAGLTIDLSAITPQAVSFGIGTGAVGTMTVTDDTNEYIMSAQVASSTKIEFRGGAGVGAWAFNALTNFADTLLKVSFIATVPVAEWAGNGTVNLGPGAQEYYVSNSGTTLTAGGTNAAGNTVYGPSGQFILSVNSTALNNTTSFYMTPLYPLQSNDLLTLEVSNDGTTWYQASTSQYAGANQGSSFYGFGITFISSSSIIVEFGNGGFRGNNATYGLAGQAWSALSTSKWRVRVCKASSPVGFGLATQTVAGLVNNQVAPTNLTAADLTSQTNCVIEAGDITAGRVQWSMVNNVVTLFMEINAFTITGGSAFFGFTLPSNIPAPTFTITLPFMVYDNTSSVVTSSLATFTPGRVMAVQRYAAGTWTGGTNTNYLRCQVSWSTI